MFQEKLRPDPINRLLRGEPHAKSDQIVRNFADYLAENKKSVGIGLDGAMLFMLSTGEEKDLDVVRRWFSGAAQSG